MRNSGITGLHRHPLAHAGAIAMQDVTLRYANHAPAALSRFSLRAGCGEFVSIVGQSGAGKTTALRVIAGFERIEAGEVWIDGRLVASAARHTEPEMRRMGLVFQHYALFPHLTVAQNVEFSLRGPIDRGRRRRLNAMMEITGLTELVHRYPHELSGGQQQRVALVRALASEPLAVLLDEPFSNLDRELRITLRREIQRIVATAGVTTILVTHDGEEALAISDSLVVMRAGRVEQCGSPEEVYSRPRTPDVAALVGPCNIVAGVVEKGRVRTEMGEFAIAEPADSSTATAPVAVLLRAPELEISAQGSRPAGRILYREFRGEFTEFGVVYPSKTIIQVRHPSSDRFSIGDQVSIDHRRGSAVVVFPQL